MGGDNTNLKLLGLLVVAGALLAVMHFDLLNPRTLRTLWPQVVAWVQGYLWELAVGGIGLVLLVGLGLGLLAYRRAQYQAALAARVASGPTLYILPRSDWKPVDVGKVDVWGRLAEALPHDEPIAFEIAGNGNEIAFALHGSQEGMGAALTQFKSEWPGMQRRPAEPDPACLPDGWHLFWVEVRPGSWKEPIQAQSNDPLRAALVELNAVVGRGRGLVQVVARNDFGTRARLGSTAFNARAEKVQNAGVRALRTREARSLEERAARAFLQVTVRCVGMADTAARAEGIARGLARAVSSAYGQRNPVRPVGSGRDPQPVLERRLSAKSQAWADDELAGLAHLVGSDMLFVAPRIKTAAAKSLPPDPEMRVIPGDWTARFAEPS